MTYFKIVNNALIELTVDEALPYESGAKRHRVLNGARICLSDVEEQSRDAEEAATAAALPALLAKQARLSQDDAECVSCVGDGAVMTLVNQTRAEWVTWAGANFPSLTAAEKQRLGVLFWVVALGVRSKIRR